MRAARLLQILLILQNRGQQTSRQLAAELEVSPRTILRDLDAMTEAGLPVIVHQGNGGGIALGFDYRTRLTGLAADEAEAMGLILQARSPMIAATGLEQAAARARAKLIESFPDKVRHRVRDAMARFRVLPPPVPPGDDDPRLRALAMAVRAGTIVRLRHAGPSEQEIHPIALRTDGQDWAVHDRLTDLWIAGADWGKINISARRFPIA